MDNYYQQLLSQKGFYLEFQVALRKTWNNEDHYSNSYIDRLNYIHQNPVRAGFVTEAQH